MQLFLSTKLAMIAEAQARMIQPSMECLFPSRVQRVAAMVNSNNNCNVATFMKIDPETVELEKAMKLRADQHKIYKWDRTQVQIEIQKTVEAIIKRRVNSIIDNAL